VIEKSIKHQLKRGAVIIINLIMRGTTGRVRFIIYAQVIFVPGTGYKIK